jgi:hypothetical protein
VSNQHQKPTRNDIVSLLQDRLCGDRDKVSVSQPLPLLGVPLWCVLTSI